MGAELITAARGPWRRRINRTVGYGLLILFALFFIYPFILSLATSFKSQADVASRPHGNDVASVLQWRRFNDGARRFVQRGSWRYRDTQCLAHSAQSLCPAPRDFSNV